MKFITRIFNITSQEYAVWYSSLHGRLQFNHLLTWGYKVPRGAVLFEETRIKVPATAHTI